MSIEDTFLTYIERNSVLKLDYLADKWRCDITDITKLITAFYDDFDQVVFKDHAVYLDYPDHDRWYIEFGKGFINDDGDHSYKRHIVHPFDVLPKQIEKWRDKPDRHMSVFAHDRKWKADHSDTTSLVRPLYIYLELDRAGSLEHAMIDANTFLKQFPYHRGLVTWYSGNNSVHIGIPAVYFGNPICTANKTCGRGKLFYNLARMVGGNIRYDNEFYDPYFSTKEENFIEYHRLFNEEPPDDPQLVRQHLEHFDPNLYNLNSMIRMPDSLHEKTNKPKTIIELPNYDPDNAPELRPWLLHYCYYGWEPVRKSGRGGQFTNVSKHEHFVIRFYAEHIEGFDPANINGAGWVHSLASPFYDDHNPDVSVCIDPEHPKFGSYRDFGNEDDNGDFVDFVSRIIKKSRRAAMDYIHLKS